MQSKANKMLNDLLQRADFSAKEKSMKNVMPINAYKIVNELISKKADSVYRPRSGRRPRPSETSTETTNPRTTSDIIQQLNKIYLNDQCSHEDMKPEHNYCSNCGIRNYLK